MDPAPTVAIVGRPNVGKSTLFNRLLKSRHAITSSQAGTTRDRLAQKWELDGYEVILVDTGGLEYGKQENIEEDIQSQAKMAIDDADIVLFVVDTIENLTTNDFAAAEILRKSKKPIVLVANKCDHPNIEQNVYNVYELGIGDPVQVSALHKTGIDDLENRVIKELKNLNYKKKKAQKKDKETTNIAILGRPNAGKSSLVNALLGSEKVIVSNIPGTTRDAIDTEIKYKDQNYNLIDTAGLRRPGKIEKGIEKFSSLRCINAIERADIVFLVIDGNERIAHQDCHIANLALGRKTGLVLVINKIDLIEKGDQLKNRILRILQKKFAFVPWAPVVFVSAKNKKNTYQVLEIAEEIKEEREKRIPTAELNAFFQKITYKHQPSSAKAKKPKFFYGSQVDINPPKFLLFFKNPGSLHFSYPRYLENELRKAYGFNGTSIELKFKNKNPENEQD